MYDQNLKRQLFLTQDWNAAWHLVVKPWLTESDQVTTGTVVVPTRGQARAMRSRMATEGIATIGVRFITPGLIRAPVRGNHVAGRELPDRAVLEFGLKQALTDMQLGYGLSDEEEGLAQSLLSRPGDPINDWEDLLRSGLDEGSFPHPLVRRVFKRLRSWLKRSGFQVPYEDEVQSFRAGNADSTSGERVLFYGFPAGYRPEWPNLSLYCREAERVVSVVPYPSFAGKPIEEQWVELWEEMTGCEAVSLPDQEERENGALARSWALNLPEESGSPAHDGVRLLVGRDPEAEMVRVFNQVVNWLSEDSCQIAVVFPVGSPSVADLSRRLAEARVRFCDEISTTGAPAHEVWLIRALLTYQRAGCSLESLWDLARLLRVSGQIGLTAGESRGWIEQVFDACQSHRVADALELPEISRYRGSDEMTRLVRDVGFWPESLAVGAAIDRVSRCVEKWGIESQIRRGSLEHLRPGDDREYPRESVIDLLMASLPERAPRRGLTRDDFAPVVLTTRKRARSLVWSHVVFAGSNAEDWPSPPEETYWLSDLARRELNRRLEDSLQLSLTEDASILERLDCLDLCNNVVGEIAFAACLQANDGSEGEPTPHPWLERILLHRARSQGNGSGGIERTVDVFEDGWRNLSQCLPSTFTLTAGLEEWLSTWTRRRDAEAPFDGFFYCTETGGLEGRRWAARLLERGFSDPIILWYEGVLRLNPVSEKPLERSRRKELGLLVHRLLAQALRGDHHPGSIHPAPPPEVCRNRLGQLLESWRSRRPRDAYWESFHLELSSLVFGLFDSVAREIEDSYLAVEYPLPGDTTLPTAHGELRISGRLDLAILDRPEWNGASARVIDFKTGSDKPLDAGKMGRLGQSLQLGVYLQSALALGARSASVEMIGISRERSPVITDGELPRIQVAFDFLGAMVHTGKFGQLTADRTRFQRVFETPLAVVPIPAAVLQKKFQVTFSDKSGDADLKGGPR
jgi:hypothetical protein